MKYDIIVIGAGSAGLNIAVFMNRIKLKVLLIEKHKVGGDCLNYGCIPSKTLISLSHIAKSASQAKSLGLKVSGKVDLSKVSKLIKNRQDIIRKHESPEYFRKKGIDVIIGAAKFISKDIIEVNKKQFSAKRIIIATGSRPRIPNIKGIETINYLTNETIFENANLPKKLIIIGGGPIGTEIAQAYHNLGSEVTIISRGDGILSKDNKELSNLLLKHLEEQGLKILTNCNPLEFKKNELICTKNNKKIKVNFDAVLIATGRKLNLDNLDLEKANIKLNNNKLILDKFLRTTNKRVYACGDIAGGYLFTHWAEYQASIVINNLLNILKKQVNPKKIAWVTYTNPEFASFGLNEDAIKKIKDVKTISVDINDVDRAITEGNTTGKLILYIKNNKIIGGSLLAKNAGEIVGELILVMDLQIPFNKLFERIYPYPTLARINKKAIQKHLGEKLTPSSINILNRLFKLLNR